jgi:hypothetical protein
MICVNVTIGYCMVKIAIYLFDSCRVSVTCLDKNDVISAVGAV